MIFLKTEDEIDLMRISNMLVARTLGEIAKAIKPGITTKDLDRLAEEFIRDNKGVPTFKGFPNQYGTSFPASICTSVNNEVVHGIPNNTVLRDGDIVSVDCGVLLNGFCGDSAYTFSVGEISVEASLLLAITKKALSLGIENAIQGKRIGDIGFAIQKCCEDKGFGVVREFVGHGIGREMHEEPQVPNYGRRGTGMLLKAGLCIAIEPMVLAGGRDVYLEANNWGTRTCDRQLAAHFEHTIAVTKKGADVLSTFQFIEEVLGENAI